MTTPRRNRVQNRALVRLQQSIDCTPMLARLLINRGICSPETAKAFIKPGLERMHDPTDLPALDEALHRVHRALTQDESITVFGHRDLDGSAATCILTELLERFDTTVGFEIQGRWEGHGFTDSGLQELRDRNTDLAILVDCGTTDNTTVEAALASGIDIVILDHHPPDGRLPSCPVINPLVPDSQYPNSALSASGLSLQFARAVLSASDEGGVPSRSFALAALGLLSDRTEVTLENRAIIQKGYRSIEKLPALRALLNGRITPALTELRWSVLPLLTAGKEAEEEPLIFKFLNSPTRKRSERLLARLRRVRDKRRRRIDEEFEYLDERIGNHSDLRIGSLLSVEIDRFVGPVARMYASERYNCPILTYQRRGELIEGWIGSGGQLNFRRVVLEGEFEEVAMFGHPNAPGIRIPESRFEAFLEHLDSALENDYTVFERAGVPWVDATLDLDDITSTLWGDVRALAPFGPGNPRPRIKIQNVRITSHTAFGYRDRHIRLESASSACSLYSWNDRARAKQLRVPSTCDIIATLDWDGRARRPALDVSLLGQQSEEFQVPVKCMETVDPDGTR